MLVPCPFGATPHRREFIESERGSKGAGDTSTYKEKGLINNGESAV